MALHSGALVVALRLSSFGTWDPENRLRCLAAYGILIPQARDRTYIHCIGRWILNHLTTREVLELLFLANISPRQLKLYKEWGGTLHVFSNEVWYSPLRSCATDFSNLKGKFCAWVCDCVCVCVCVCVREREDVGIPGNLWSSAPAKQTWDSAHTCEIWMSFVPWESHSAWLIQAELPAASFQDAVQTRILMKITTGRRSNLSEGGGCRAGSLASWQNLSIYDLKPLVWKQYVMQGALPWGVWSESVSSPQVVPRTNHLIPFSGNWHARIFFPPMHIKLCLLQSDLTAQFDWDRFTSTVLTFYYLSPSKVNVKVAQSCLTLCNPMDCTVHEIL